MPVTHLYTPSPSSTGSFRRRAKTFGPRSLLHRPSLLRRRIVLLWLMAMASVIVFSFQILQLQRGASQISMHENLQHLLIDRGIHSSDMDIESMDWFVTYFGKLKRLLRKSKSVDKTEKQHLLERLKNLNNMDMPFRKVDGHKVPCLDALPGDKIQDVDLPPPSDSPIKRLQYIQLAESSSNDDQHLRFSMFSGKQSWREREESFHIKEEMNVHCGFAGINTGFDIEEADRRYLDRCQVAVSTCNFGAGDDLAQPIGMSESSLKKACYVAFWDTITVTTSEEMGERIDPVTKSIGLWRVVIVRNLPFADQRRNGKIPKMLAHRLFPNARFSIWVDAKSQFRRDPIAVLEALLWRPGAVLAISEHGARSSIFKEGEAIVTKHKATAEDIGVQLFQYRIEGLPENVTLGGQRALAEASVIIREHTPLTNLFMCLWFNEVVRFSARDQVSFPYVLRRLGILHPNFFPVCTRRALVNNLGHRRKPKVKLRRK